MQTLLFFDDWNLELHENIQRKLGKPHWVEEANVFDPGYVRSYFYPTVFWDEAIGRWRAFYIAWPKGEAGENRSLATSESEDGIHWQVPDLTKRFPEPGRLQVNQIFRAGMGTEPGNVYLDERETDPERRYKLLYIPGSSKVYTDQPDSNRLAVSADGYQWRAVEGVGWGDWISDAPNGIYYNQHRGSYVTPCRPAWGDRRVALIETRDWQHWSRPEVVVHPDPLDPPFLQFYGMPTFPYEGMYVGLLWAQHCDPLEIRGNNEKNTGSIDGQLTYSYDGWHFNRAFRDAFVPLTEPGQFGCGCVYPGSLCVDKTNQIRIYSHGRRNEHQFTLNGDKRNENASGLMLHTLRLDGFMYLETTSNWGRVITRPLLFQEPGLRLNIQAPVGDVAAQIPDQSGKAMEGLTFEDCVPFHGDDLFWEPQWKSGKTLRDVIGKPVRVEVRMYKGRLYAMRGGFQIADLKVRRNLAKAGVL
jgi:hypothetical protein